MSVRRLADTAIQPTAFAFTPDNQRWAEAKAAEYPAGRQQSAVIPILWRAQEQEGWVTRAAIETVGRLLDMPYIRVLEVATFYTQFQLKPVGSRAHVQVCGTTPCMLRGAEELVSICQHRIHHDPLTTNDAGTLSWEEVECAGACVNAPMITIGNDTYEDLTPERFTEILDAFEAGKGDTIKPGTQIDRVTSAAEGGPTTLLETPTAERTYKPFPPPPAPAPAPGAPAAAAPPAPKPVDPPKASNGPEKTEGGPTTPGKKNQVSEEAAPALKEPAAAPKVSVTAAEGERQNANAAAKADGAPNKAMREDATGAESPAGKVTTGRGANKTPQKLFEAPQGPADDLKLISGIGPALERALNAMGIAKWSQVAGLTQAQIDLVEGELGFRGRASRDNWLQQADVLARGGVEEYRRVFGKEPR
jgi:NADH-quinone oxidoreductase subunit E